MSDDRPLRIYGRLLGYVIGHRVRLIATLLALCATSLSTLAVPWLAKNLFQGAVLHQQTASIQLALGLIVAASAAMSLGRFVAEQQIGFISQRMLQQLRTELVSKLVRLPMSFFVNGRGGDAIARVINDVHMLTAFLYDAIFAVGSDLLVVLGSVGFLFYLSWQLALVSILGLPVAGAIVAVTSRWMRRRAREVQDVMADMTSLVSEQVGAMSAIHAFGAATYERHRFVDSARCYGRRALLSHRVSAGARASVNFLGVVGIALVLGFGAWSLDRAMKSNDPSRLTLDRLVGFALYAALLAEPMTRFARAHLEIHRALGSAQRIFELLDLPEMGLDGTMSLPRCPRAQLRFEAVHFEYRLGEPVLHNLDVTFEPNETVAIVGHSGAGKSTLIQLALRMYDPTSGRVLMNGQDVRDLRVADLRQNLGWVSQEPYLFRGTVAENIRYGSWGATQREVEQAARMACADAFIKALPHGFESRVGERGVTLSGGERARIAWARVILRSPALVILDEATAALDAETERRLWDATSRWMSERTVLVITHRQITLQACSRVVVLENGRLVGDGTAEELRDSCATFRRIFAEQADLARAA
jgi:subfamily B ATP-binding cassette protein MsbA